MNKKNDMLNNVNTDNFVNYRGRGTSPAELRSSGPKQRPDKGSDESSAEEEVSSNREGDLPTDRIRFEEHDEKEYEKHLRRFFKGDNTGSDK